MSSRRRLSLPTKRRLTFRHAFGEKSGRSSGNGGPSEGAASGAGVSARGGGGAPCRGPDTPSRAYAAASSDSRTLNPAKKRSSSKRSRASIPRGPPSWWLARRRSRTALSISAPRSALGVPSTMDWIPETNSSSRSRNCGVCSSSSSSSSLSSAEALPELIADAWK